MRDRVALENRLEHDAAAIDFFQALRLIENAYPALPRVGTSLRAREDAVRLGQDAELAFQPAALRGYRRAEGRGRARLAVNFLGLLGANGPLPRHLTEYVRDRVRHGGDTTLRAFLDVFNHRMLCLFYRARASAEPVINLDRADGDRYSVFVGSLFGIGAPGLRERDTIGDFAKLHFAGLLANQARPASGLTTILREYFGLPLRIEQFVGHWMPLSDEILSRLGAPERDNRLGSSMVLGRRVWDSQSRFRIVVGPVGYPDYLRFMPGGDSLKRLLAWVKMYCGLALDWEVQLILKKAETPPLRLGGPARLGWTSWVAVSTPRRDPDQLRISRAVIQSQP